MSAAPLVACAAAVAGLLVAEQRGAARASGVAKALASASFLWAGVAWGALATGAGRLLLAGLALCALGDVLLIPPGAGLAFQLGIGAFALGHVAYAAACLELGVAPLALAAGALVALPTLALAWRWLAPHLGGALRPAVGGYLGVVIGMAVLTLAAAAQGAPLALAAGGVAFALSDLSVARDRFITEGFVNRALGLPLYFAAQLAIAWSAAG